MAHFVARLAHTLIPTGLFCVAGASYGAYLARWLTHICPDRPEGFFVYAPAFRMSDQDAPPPLLVAPDPALVASLAEDEQPESSATGPGCSGR